MFYLYSFDSIPFDLGVLYAQLAAEEKYGTKLQRVRGRVRAMQGTWSGGTLASFRATMAAAAQDRSLISTLINPFALTPGFTGPEQPDGTQPLFDETIDSWVAPFLMATINTKTVHRSNLLLNHRYGTDFEYDEMLVTGPGEQGEAAAKVRDKSSDETTQPGEGPTKEEREAGFYDLLFLGHTAQGQSIRASVKGDMDPGYGSTSKMIAEAAVCLFNSRGSAPGGITTPAAAMGTTLIDRLEKNAGVTFELEA